jgi:hypothetical protein
MGNGTISKLILIISHYVFVSLATLIDMLVQYFVQPCMSSFVDMNNVATSVVCDINLD